ncbi:MAG: SMP-30/Gluconolaconase/LRE-like region-containing protein [Alphaproteobacteria bacterium]|nr:SMP-30/Gluconolaconase/LRE-like region-containing protein [Alphaproteobacteria bacterium]MDB5719453.1 SMP-30/Gluconolaconase/LRE-like region-containing protein [Alphaproteobacteria bacterium]
MVVIRNHMELDRIIDPASTLDILWRGEGFFEGPVWLDDECGGGLLFSDIAGDRINLWRPDGRVSVHAGDIFTGDREGAGKRLTVGDREVRLIGPNGIARDGEGRIVFCGYGTGQVVRIECDGGRTLLASSYRGRRLNTPNDLVFRSDGSLYFTDSSSVPPGAHDPEIGANPPGVYRLAAGGLALVCKGFVTPNGLAFTPDERFLYVNDTLPKTISRFRVEADGRLTEEQAFADMNGDEARGAPDGMKVDLEGNVYCTGPGGLWIFAPDGTRLGTIVTPEQLTNCAFGGGDRCWLFMTGPSFLYRIRLRRPGSH